MPKPQRPGEQFQETLIAYLDGELDGQAARSVELRLSRDARLRAEAESLGRTWQLLDYLPRPEPTANFASRTLERVSSLRPVVKTVAVRPWPPWVLALGWVAAVLLAGTLGYVVVAAMVKPPQPVPAESVDPEQQWVALQPRAIREELQKLAPDRRSARIAELRTQERKHRDEWQVAIRDWDDLQQLERWQRLQALPELKLYVEATLIPMLSPKERTRLRNADGKWPQYPQTLVELADSHPAVLPPGIKQGPTRFEELPAEVQKLFPGLMQAAHEQKHPLPKFEGKWPDFALAITNRRKEKALPVPLGPCKPDQFAPAVHQFLDWRLGPALTDKEKKELKADEGRWPAYPFTLVRLAKEHRMRVPGMALPGEREQWQPFRAAKK
jgi:hypothetical protein